MKRFFKILLKLLATVMALVLIAILVIIFIIDPNDYKTQIADLVENAIGRVLTIEGDIKLTFYPWLGFDLGKVRLANAPGFEESGFAKIDKTQVQVKLVPLLSQQVEVDSVLLEGVEVTLTRKPDDRTNWDDLLGGEEKPEASKTEMSKPVNQLIFKHLDLRHAKIVWNDEKTGSRYILSDVNLRTSALLLMKPIELSFNADLEISGAAPLRLKLALKSQVILNQDSQQYRIAPLQLTVRVQSAGMPVLRFFINTELIDVDLKKEAATFGGIRIKLMDAVLSGDVFVEQLQSIPRLKGKCKIIPKNCNVV